MKRAYYILSCFLFIGFSVSAQVPHFSQFFMAPHYVNPALTGTQYGDWCIMGNLRQQWGNASTPFNTQSMALEYKFYNENNDNVLAVGGALMNDQTMNGAFRSVYFNGTMAYHLNLSKYSNIAAGFFGSYNNRRLDYSKLTFGQQFTSGGFDLSLPTGETGLASMKPYLSLGSGILYTHFSDDNRFVLDVGGAAFDINQPSLSFLNDQSNRLNIRYAGNLNVQYYPNDLVALNFFSVYHRQATQNYFSVGGAVGRKVGSVDSDIMGFIGAWYREGDAVYPYVSLKWSNVQVGLTYDIVVSKQNKGPVNPQVFELSFIYTGKVPKSKYYDCPFKRRIVLFP